MIVHMGILDFRHDYCRYRRRMCCSVRPSICKVTTVCLGPVLEEEGKGRGRGSRRRSSANRDNRRGVFLKLGGRALGCCSVSSPLSPVQPPGFWSRRRQQDQLTQLNSKLNTTKTKTQANQSVHWSTLELARSQSHSTQRRE